MLRVGLKFSALLCLMYAAYGCDKAKFAGQTRTADKQDQDTPKDTPTETLPDVAEAPVVAPVPAQPVIESEPVLTQKFALTTATQPIDMVWIIDNSPSMADNITKVHENFAAFADSISARVDISFTLISRQTGLRSIALPADLVEKGHKQINLAVGSTNPLSMLASGFCPPASTYIDVDNSLYVCDEWTSQNNETPLLIEQMQGQLASPTPDAKLIIVIVSDDGSTAISNDTFLGVVRAKVPNFDPVVFGFVPPDQECAGPDWPFDITYESLIAATGGASYSLCDTDWAANFAKFSEAAMRVATSKFKMTAVAKKITKVSIDGKPLDTKNFTFADGFIVLGKNVLKTGNQQLVVEYETGDSK